MSHMEFWNRTKSELADSPFTADQVDKWTAWLTLVSIPVGVTVAILTHELYIGFLCWGAVLAAIVFGGRWYAKIIREKPSRREAEARRERLEQQAIEIASLVSLTDAIIQTEISEVGQHSEWLGQLLALQRELQGCHQSFKDGSASYNDTLMKSANLLYQVESLRRPPYKEQLSKRAKDKSYYEVLGVDPKASRRRIEKAYRAKMKALYRDRTTKWTIQFIPPEVDDFLTETSMDITLAYRILSNAEKRREYDQRIAGQPSNSIA